ncbi:hypothetical protein SAMN05421837_11060 [Amycolatopsis pretoriensis]|uniref:Uncharacterized protein n=1 Tax=Amycolatopsis pretoriensis TaxID=218821 RepID=A0A1H5RFN4_9PSEU|nr:hypothetical protein SAMN05421837_11060 [Amycolatopsis pretoriensis]
MLAYNDLVLRQLGELADSEILAQAQLAACGGG